MQSGRERNSTAAVREPAAITLTMVFSVLIAAGVLLINRWWEKPEALITLVLALLLAFASGVALMRRIANQKSITLAALWQSLMVAAAGLLLVVLAAHHDGHSMLAGVVLSGIGLGCASQVARALLQPRINLSVHAGSALVASIGATVVVTWLIHSQAALDFAFALLLDLVLLGALLARIAECDAAG